MIKFYIETYGCKTNQYESEAIREKWVAHGASECSDPEKADYIIINSCAITAHAERDGRNALYRLKRRAPDSKIIYTGCGAQFIKDFIPRKGSFWIDPDFCIPQKEKHYLLAGPDFTNSSPDESRLWKLTSYKRSRPVIKIQDGCTQGCTYCIVPQTRGKPASRQPQEILYECRSLIMKGFHELVLSGINLRQYGVAGFGNFWALLGWLDKALHEEFGKEVRLRISSLEPGQFNEKSYEIIAQCTLLCPHIHLSLQHGSETILKSMGRGHYTRDNIYSIKEMLDGIFPLMGFGVDVIAGFPGETEKDFQIVCRVLKNLGVTYAHIFPYSRRQGAASALFPGQLSRSEKHSRALVLRELVETQKKDFIRAQLKLNHLKAIFDTNAENGIIKGINEYYSTCYLPSQKLERNIIKVKPVRIHKNGIQTSLENDI